MYNKIKNDNNNKNKNKNFIKLAIKQFVQIFKLLVQTRVRMNYKKHFLQTLKSQVERNLQILGMPHEIASVTHHYSCSIAFVHTCVSECSEFPLLNN